MARRVLFRRNDSYGLGFNRALDAWEGKAPAEPFHGKTSAPSTESTRQQARQEPRSTRTPSSINPLSEVLVIAAGLSIQDPRERPMDQKEAAEQAHQYIAP